MSLIFNLKKPFKDLLKTVAYHEYCGEYNAEDGLDSENIDEIQSFVKSSWEEYVKSSPGLLGPNFDLFKLKFFAFYEEFLACYESQPMGECKII